MKISWKEVRTWFFSVFVPLRLNLTKAFEHMLEVSYFCCSNALECVCARGWTEAVQFACFVRAL